jgi:hypothetical protein
MVRGGAWDNGDLGRDRRLTWSPHDRDPGLHEGAERVPAGVGTWLGLDRISSCAQKDDRGTLERALPGFSGSRVPRT